MNFVRFMSQNPSIKSQENKVKKVIVLSPMVIMALKFESPNLGLEI